MPIAILIGDRVKDGAEAACGLDRRPPLGSCLLHNRLGRREHAQRSRTGAQARSPIHRLIADRRIQDRRGERIDATTALSGPFGEPPMDIVWNT
jgi:hypothetical protein